MNFFRFWFLWACLVMVATVWFCCYVGACPVEKQHAAPPAIKPKPVVSKPTIKVGQPSRVLVRLSTAYRAEYRKPKSKQIRSEKP